MLRKLNRNVKTCARIYTQQVYTYTHECVQTFKKSIILHLLKLCQVLKKKKWNYKNKIKY